MTGGPLVFAPSTMLRMVPLPRRDRDVGGTGRPNVWRLSRAGHAVSFSKR